jgi:flagellar biosynthesis/type III secretory pathway M-ring protein FliF/YscJ
MTSQMRRGPSPVLLAVVALVLLVGISGLLFTWISSTSLPATVPYSEFLDDVGSGRVTRVSQTGTTLEVSGTDGDYQVVVPTVLTDVFADVSAAAEAGGSPEPMFVAQPAPDTSWLGLALTALLSIAVVVLVVLFVVRLVVRPTRAGRPGTLADRLRELDEAHRSGLITDDERARQRARILDEV